MTSLEVQPCVLEEGTEIGKVTYAKGHMCMAPTPAPKEKIMLSGSALHLLQYEEFKE